MAATPITRRKAAAFLALAPAGCASTLRRSDGEAFFRHVYKNEAEPSVLPFNVGAVYRNEPEAWRDLPPEDRPTARLPAPERSPDYAPLGASFSDAPFRLDGGRLSRLARQNAFDVDGLSENVLFGLRGCALEDDATASLDGRDYRSAFMLREARVDYRAFRCVVGVWNVRSGRIWAHPGSTVPSIDYLYGQARLGDADHWGNQMATGLYEYEVGGRGAQKGAFLQKTTFPVLRPQGGLMLTMDDWDKMWKLVTFGPVRHLNPRNDIHAALLDGLDGPARFASSGGPVLPGLHDARFIRGPWAAFRAAAGLINPKPERDHGRAFRFMLLTGRDLRLADEQPNVVRLRFGSRHATLRTLRRRFDLPETEEYDHALAWRLLRAQRLAGTPVHGVISPAEAENGLAGV